MKKTICLAIILISRITSVRAELPKFEWTATLKIVDEKGTSVPGAKVRVWYGTNEFAGASDMDGSFTASHQDATEDLAFEAGKPGYYSFRMAYHKGRTYDKARFNPRQTIILKRIINPIPMYAKRVGLKVPVQDKPVAYDFEIGDWIRPYGKGTQADILFTAHFEKTPIRNGKILVSFPNKGDGIQEFMSPRYYLGDPGSELRSLEQAPADGYQGQWTTIYGEQSGNAPGSISDPNRNFYFRIRTELDGNGNVASARYGKIYRDFMDFDYYFNPNVNDRNVEFDPRKNLTKGLQPLEAVNKP